MKQIQLTGVITKHKGEEYCSLCLELDISSHGRTISEARKMLVEAVSLYLESCFEERIPFLRPVSPEDNPLVVSPSKVKDTFKITVKKGSRTSIETSSCKTSASN